MEKQVDEATGRLLVGMMETMQVIVLVLEGTGALNRAALHYALERRLATHADDALEAAPIAMMLQFLRPDDPPRPVLRLIPGGKR